jgi:transposase
LHILDINNIIELIKKVEQLEVKVAKQEQIITKQEQIIQSLKNENVNLKERLAKYETRKNSNNSSTPPSKDENRPTRKSLREKTGRKPGGQVGRKGNNLKMLDTVDEIKEHNPIYCQCCGKDLNDIQEEFYKKRQVIDIPEIKIKVTEHRLYKKVCSCGHTALGTFPDEANAPVSYGNNISSLIGYLHTRQYIPFKRLEEILNDVFNVPVSEGGIHHLLGKLVNKAVPAYDLIKQKLLSKNQGVIGTDETGVKVSGKKNWVWTWQSDNATFITITDNRSGKSIEATFPDGFKNSVLVHDCWKSHFNTNAISHQICMAHLLRDLNYLTELYGHKWSKICKNLFKTALNIKSQMKNEDYYNKNPKRITIEKRLDRLLEYNLDSKYKEIISFQNRLVKYKDYIFNFLYYPNVPPDNNASERAIRNIKVKQKISGQFKSAIGAFNFAVLRSITDTSIKNNQNVLNCLKIISNLYSD